MMNKGESRWLHLLLCIAALLEMSIAQSACAEILDYAEYAREQPAAADGAFVLDSDDVYTDAVYTR